MNKILVSESTVLSKAKNRNNRPRRTLQALQVSATDKDLLVPSPILMHKNEKKIKEVGRNFKILSDEVLDKENGPVRRSKRKNAVKEEASKGDQEKIASTNSKLPKVSSKSKKVSAVKKNKKLTAADVKQSKMDSFIVSEPSLSIVLEPESTTILESTAEVPENSVNKVEITKESNSDASKKAINDPISAEITVCPSRSVSDDAVAMLTSDHPPDSYWKTLADERRQALEKALYENSQLWDQLQVLEAENSQLKSCLEEAEKIAEIVRQSLS
ncbi:uncharacterized protein TNCT_64041 [Trichonephila clavata]|uniref:Geminin n=1 Tax=Trichonephila clavata TaxID=2740835 RepID=A0A8X6IE79_TRICU|nr:uncharacterized protein TNCT_64041 [Trichonephila clavata]